MSRKRNHRMSPALRLRQQRGETKNIAPHELARINQLHDEAEVTRKMVLVRSALVLMLEGKADDKHMRVLGGEVNTCWIAAEKIAGGELVQERLEAAGAALEEAKRIKAEHGRYGLTGPGRIALSEGVDVIELVYRATSPVQLDAAERSLNASLAAARRQGSAA